MLYLMERGSRGSVDTLRINRFLCRESGANRKLSVEVDIMVLYFDMSHGLTFIMAPEDEEDFINNHELLSLNPNSHVSEIGDMKRCESTGRFIGVLGGNFTFRGTQE